MYRKHYLGIFLVVISVFVSERLCLADQLSSPSAEEPRNQIIEKEFDCIRAHLKTQKDQGWDNVCYAAPVDRNELIDQTLNQLSAEREQTPPSRTASQSTYTAPDPWSEPDSSYTSERRIEKPAPTYYEYSYSEELKKDQFEFGTEISHISYKEPEFDLEDEGMMYGVYTSYAHHMDEEDPLNFSVINMYKFEGKVSFGTVDYESAPSGTIEDINDYMVEVRALFGYDFRRSVQTRITPYTGLGYRYLNDDSSGQESSTGALGYERQANYLYLPIGFEFENQLPAGWAINLTGEFDVFLFGKQKSFLSDVDSSLPDVENDQRRGFGLRGSVQFLKKLESVNLSVTPFIRYWHIKNSDISTAVGPTGIAVSGLEPDNNSTEIGVKLGVQF